MSASPRTTPPRNVKIAIASIIGLLLTAFAIFLIMGRVMTPSLATAKGFLGTRATLFADINLVAQIILLVGLLVGYGFARGHNVPAHQYNQTGWVFFNIILTVFIMAVAFNRQVVPGIPDKLLRAYYATSAIHSLLGTITILCAVYLILWMNQLIPKAWGGKWWRNMMRATLAMYWITGLFGLGTYYVWYVQEREATTETAQVTPEATSVPQPGGKVIVPLANYEFAPKELTIPVGTTVVWRNDDPDPHTVTFDKGEFATFAFEEGATHEILFDKVGDYFYYCEYHGSPGLQNMAGVIHVREASEVAAVPTSVPVPTQTPQPTAAPIAAAPLGPTGFAEFQDAGGRNNRFIINLVNLAPATTGEYQAWLIGESAPLSLGVLAAEPSGVASLTYQGNENLVEKYSGFVVTIETAGAKPTQPSAQVVVGGNLATGVLGPVRQLLARSDAAPENTGLALGLLHQADQLLLHALAVNAAVKVGDKASANRHAEHILIIVDGKNGTNVKDLDENGKRAPVGDGFGMVNYANAIEAQAQAALAAPDASENVKINAEYLLTVAGNIREWSTQIMEQAVNVHLGLGEGNASKAQTAADEVSRLADAMLDGVDANNNNVIEATTGEGGAYTLYFYRQYLAAMSAQTKEALNAAATAQAGLTPGAPAATNTPEPTPTSVIATDPVIIVYKNFEIVPAQITIKVGTKVTFKIEDSLHQPYNFDPPNVFEAPGGMGDGATYFVKFAQEGTFTLRCGYHSKMVATVVVVP